MKMQSRILTMALGPLVCLGLVTMLIGNMRISEVVAGTIENGLRGTAVSVRDTLTHAGEGSYQLEEGKLYKGEFNISDATELADNIKKATDTDITIFFGDTRYMTSVIDEDGRRVIGTAAGAQVVSEVINNGKDYFAQNVDVVGKPYYGYYVPLFEDGTNKAVGMVFAGIPQSDAKDQISRIILLIAGIMIAFLFVCAILLFVAVHRMVATLHMGTDALEMASKGKLNFSINEGTLKRKDEIGNISRAISLLKSELVEIVASMQEQSHVLDTSSAFFEEKTESSTEYINQVRQAVEEIALGAGSQAQETQTATESIIEMGAMIEELTTEINDINESAKLIKKLGEMAADTLKSLDSFNQKTKESIDIIYEQTNTTNNSAQKIKAATELITEIAEETNLLSLNASIEAARAGEQGRGFAVVASQIQKLADQSNESARQIKGIIDSLLDDSHKAVETMEEVKEVISQQNASVKNTDEQVGQVLGHVEQAITAIGKVAEKTTGINETRVSVTDTVQNLSAVAQENAASTQQSAASVNQVSEIILDIAENAKQLKDIAKQLNKYIVKFEI
ncbi:MAG: cache domain-containing protein [Lachnospiraceae bacterium]|nr:cache domain-containing protein [Lachnospiraceae bacterium]